MTKTWRKNKPSPPSLICFCFPVKKSLCVSNTLHNYLIRRKAWGGNETQVLVSFTKLHKAVSSSTVSRWLKQALEKAGIYIEIFKRHSTLAVSSTKADVSGVFVSDILKQGNWFKTLIFQKITKVILDPSS